MNTIDQAMWEIEMIDHFIALKKKEISDIDAEMEKINGESDS